MATSPTTKPIPRLAIDGVEIVCLVPGDNGLREVDVLGDDVMSAVVRAGDAARRAVDAYRGREAYAAPSVTGRGVDVRG